jgi:hypothetical protein
MSLIHETSSIQMRNTTRQMLRLFAFLTVQSLFDNLRLNKITYSSLSIVSVIYQWFDDLETIKRL